MDDIVTISLGLAGLAGGGALSWRVLNHRRATTAEPTDVLTGLHDRRRFDLDVERHLRRGGEPTAILMVDVDHLADFNRDHGPDEGDELLRTIGAALARQLRREDVAYRYTGDRFSVILPATDARAALVVAERIRRAIETAMLPVDHTPTTSIGVATGAAGEVDSVVDRAALALRTAKSDGRNRISVR